MIRVLVILAVEVDAMSREMLSLARAQVLAVSAVSATERLDRRSADAAIRAAVLIHGGVDGCVAALAREFGDRPETAPLRMRWAKQVVSTVYAATPAGPPHDLAA
jgi:hypothetical protein